MSLKNFFYKKVVFTTHDIDFSLYLKWAHKQRWRAADIIDAHPKSVLLRKAITRSGFHTHIQ